MKRVMVFGTFDILHPGHIHFLKNAKRLGDYLIVSLARNTNVRRIKGRLPRHSERERVKMLGAVKYVDRVVLGAKKDYIGHILRYKPAIIALGYDQTHYTANLKELLAARGLSVKIKRLKPYHPNIYKTSKLF